METWTQVYNPLGALWLSALVAVVPIVFFFVTLAVLRWQAYLAGLPKAPSRYNPRVNPTAAVDRAIEVLGAIVETGALPAAAAIAEAERLRHGVRVGVDAQLAHVGLVLLEPLTVARKHQP